MNQREITLDLLDKTLSRNLGWIASADSKIAPILAIDTAMLGVLAVLLPLPNKWSPESAILSAITSLLLIGSLICLVAANFPRLQGSKSSVIFFGGIAEYDREKYAGLFLKGLTDKILKDYAYQCHRNAEIVRTKFMFVKLSMILLYSSLPVFLIAIALLYRLKA